MPTTTRGYRYPASTDPVANTDVAIQNLATDVDAKLGREVKTGQGSVTTDGSGVATITISSVAGTNPTAVHVTLISSTNQAFVTAHTATSITFTVRNMTSAGAPTVNSTSVTYRWTAVWA